MEPWLTGKWNDLPPIVAAVLYSFEHARDDLRRWTADLTDEQIWRRSGDVAPVGFHIRHIAGSVDRLMTYAIGTQLSAEQMKELEAEKSPEGISRDELLAVLDRKLAQAESVIRSFDPSGLEAIREIGRRRTPVPLGVLLIHIAEHTQRHVGAAIVTAKTARVPASSNQAALGATGIPGAIRK
jgi:hypothetical protein